jgi:hypothetical protein
MAGYLGTKAVLLSTTAANVVGNAEIGGDLTVGGTVTADGLTVDGEATFGTATGVFPDEAVLVRGNNGTSGYINGLGVGSSNAQFRIFADDTNITAGSIKFDIRNRDRLLIEDNGDISFYEDTGTTPKFFWDASAESLGIGTSSPSGKLDILTGTTGNVLIDAEGGSNFHAKVVNDAGDLHLGSRNTAADTYITSQRNVLFKSSSSETEAMRIDPSGNLLVGKTSADFGATAGMAMQSNDTLYVARSGGGALALNRLSSDGDIAEFRKDGTTVGSIGSKDGDIAIGTGDTGLRFLDGTDAIVPQNISTNVGRDNAIHLGTTGARFKDGHFSGTVNATAFVGDGSALTGIDATPPTTYGAVGTYGFFRHTSLGATISAGSTYAGSSLVAAGASTGLGNTATTVKTGTNGSAPSGTWRAMGHHTARSDSYVLTTFVRIS